MQLIAEVNTTNYSGQNIIDVTSIPSYKALYIFGSLRTQGDTELRLYWNGADMFSSIMYNMSIERNDNGNYSYGYQQNGFRIIANSFLNSQYTSAFYVEIPNADLSSNDIAKTILSRQAILKNSSGPTYILTAGSPQSGQTAALAQPISSLRFYTFSSYFSVGKIFIYGSN